MSKTRHKQKGRSDVRVSFAGIPREVMLSDSFHEIGPNAVRVVLWLCFQYKGNNNGYLSATRNEAKVWGIAGASTLARAIVELTEHRLIVMTKQGRFMNPGGSPNLYALTWAPVDERHSQPLDIAPSREPLRKDWKRTLNTAPPAPILETVAPVSGPSRAISRSTNGTIAPVLRLMDPSHPVQNRDTLLNTMGGAVVLASSSSSSSSSSSAAVADTSITSED